MSGWESNQVEHTFESGRTMLIRRSLSMQWLILRSIEDGDPELAGGLSEWFERGSLNVSGEQSPEQRMSQLQVATKVQKAVVESMFLHPKVYWNPDDMPPGNDTPDGEIPVHMLAADLKDSELTEVLELAFKGVAEANRFPVEPDGADGGPSGASVGKKPKPRARAGAGKH